MGCLNFALNDDFEADPTSDERFGIHPAVFDESDDRLVAAVAEQTGLVGEDAADRSLAVDQRIRVELDGVGDVEVDYPVGPDRPRDVASTVTGGRRERLASPVCLRRQNRREADGATADDGDIVTDPQVRLLDHMDADDEQFDECSVLNKKLLGDDHCV